LPRHFHRPYKGEDGGISGGPSHHAARADLALEDGRAFRSEIRIAKGEAANPLSEEFLNAKFLRLAAGRLGAEVSARILGTVKALETAASASSLLHDCTNAAGQRSRR
jgi:hypothetical protein